MFLTKAGNVFKKHKLEDPQHRKREHKTPPGRKERKKKTGSCGGRAQLECFKIVLEIPQKIFKKKYIHIRKKTGLPLVLEKS
jgi:hypothetical protein